MRGIDIGNWLLFLIVIIPFKSFSQPSLDIYGSLRGIMHNNDTTEKVRLNLMGPLTGTYGLGAVAGMDGEILILNGQTYVTKTNNGSIATDKSSDYGAALLVVADIAEWDTLTVNDGLRSMEDLEDYLANENYFSGAPFPFIILSANSNISWHVIARPTEPMTEQMDHREMGVNGRYEGEALIFGFWSNSHQGIFTHQGHNIHAHFQSDDKLYAGHVDEVSMDGGFSLLIPASK